MANDGVKSRHPIRAMKPASSHHRGERSIYERRSGVITLIKHGEEASRCNPGPGIGIGLGGAAERWFLLPHTLKGVSKCRITITPIQLRPRVLAVSAHGRRCAHDP